MATASSRAPLAISPAFMGGHCGGRTRYRHVTQADDMAVPSRLSSSGVTCRRWSSPPTCRSPKRGCDLGDLEYAHGVLRRRLHGDRRSDAHARVLVGRDGNEHMRRSRGRAGEAGRRQRLPGGPTGVQPLLGAHPLRGSARMQLERQRRVLQRLRARLHSPRRAVAVRRARRLHVARRVVVVLERHHATHDGLDAGAVSVDDVHVDITWPDDLGHLRPSSRANVIEWSGPPADRDDAPGVRRTSATVDLRQVQPAPRDALSADLPARWLGLRL